jgi:hypothetical protein
MSAMSRWFAACLLLVATAVLSAGCDRALSSSLALELRSNRVIYELDDDFSGTLTFTNRSAQRIRERFRTGRQYNIAFYDSLGIVRNLFPDIEIPAFTYLELEPFATRVDTLDFPLSDYPDTIPLGIYRVRAWVEGHEEIYSEITIGVSGTQR